MKKLVTICCLLLLASIQIHAAVDADKLMFKVSKIALHTSDQCDDSAPQLFSVPTPKSQDFLGDDLDLGEAQIPKGTYKCIIFELSDHVTFSPKTTEGVCDAATDYTFDVCDDAALKESDGVSLIDGTNVNCTNSEDTVPIFISTAGSANGFAFGPPSKTFDQDDQEVTGGMLLEEAMVVDNDDIVGTFKVLTTDTVIVDLDENDQDECQMDQPKFTFSSE